MIIDISFQAQLPPPYAFAAVIKCKIEDEVFVDFQQEYIGRDGLEETEILAEGFSMNDDYQWKGTISSNWRSILEEFESQTYSEEPDKDNYIHVSINNEEKGFPKDVNQSAFLIQELIQAVLERSERVLPLSIEIVKDQKNHILEWKFGDRVVEVDERSINWNKGRELLSTIYSIDYDSIKPSKKPAGVISIHFGDGRWYSITNKVLIEQLSVMLD